MQNIDNAVVQLFVQNSLFNWLEPYKSPEQVSASGSAFFIDSQGFLLTNYHVVSQASGVQLQLPFFGKQRFNVEVVGVYPESDIALLRVAADGCELIKKELGAIPYISLGNSDSVDRAQEISCLGYPLGQETLKITQGIVSGYQEFNGKFFLQVTAALNPGSSGGPALDANNCVIGLNTAIIPDAQNIGYLLPINEIKQIIETLRTTKVVHSPFLGCEVNYANADMLKYLGNPAPGGIYVHRVYPQSSFADAGIQEGDMIYAINKYEIDLYGETTLVDAHGKIPFTSLINRFAIGQKIAIDFYRAGKQMQTEFVLACHDLLPVREFFPEFEIIDYESIAGIVVMQLSLNHVGLLEDKKPQFSAYRQRCNQYQSRLVITQVFQNSLTQQARVLHVGDVIQLINNKPVQTLADFRQAALLDNNFFALKTEEGKCMVLALENIVNEEDALAAQYFYPVSPLIEAMRGLL